MTRFVLTKRPTRACLRIAKMMSPIAPFFSEWMFGRLNGVTALESEISVHTTNFPVVEAQAVDLALEPPHATCAHHRRSGAAIA